MLMKKLKGVTALFCALTLTAAVLSGCSTIKNPAPSEPSKAAQTSVPQKPFRITIMAPMVNTEPTREDNEAFKKVQEYTNTQLEVTWVPSAAYRDKVSTALASGDLPMILTVTDYKFPSLISYIRSGGCWEIGPYIKDFPNLNKYINKDVFNNVSVDGKNHQLFRTRDIAGDGMIFRKDWLEALEIKEPKTLDEFYEMIKAFAAKDPDKNGKSDTLGLTEDKDMRGFKILLAWHGGPNAWEEKSGKLVPDFMTKEFLDTMKFYKRMYTEKIMNQDFAIATRAQKDDNLSKGKAGVVLTGLDQYTRYGDVVKLFPSAKLDLLNTIKGPKGERIMAEAGYTGVFVYPKISVKTEDDLKQILSFYEKCYDPKVSNIFKWGLEGKHYTVENGKAVQTDEQIKLFAAEVNPIRQIKNTKDETALPAGKLTPLDQKKIDLIEKNSNIAVFNPTEPFISNTYTEKGTDLIKLINDARIKYIMGEIDDTAWNKVLEQWTKNGGDKVIHEYEAELSKANKK